MRTFVTRSVLLSFILTAISLNLSSQAGTQLVKVIVSPDHKDWTYKVNETAKFSVQVLKYGNLLENAGTVVVKGPAGAYEEEGFKFGTRALLDYVKNSSAYTLIGGGHTSAALARLGFSRDDFFYVSVAGGALITYLSGKDLPGVKALQNAVSITSQRAPELVSGKQ